ncbi:MAG TPA: adenylate/guanylate cyclase domain-containing protein [Rhodocyclaceae bacterium]|nr:adenylate/guanylate cyclase domain-containing protein [Rhodocyclaceae bacterium]
MSPADPPADDESGRLHAEVERLRAEVARLREQLATTERIYAHFVPQQLLQFLAIKNIRDIRLGLQTERRMTILFSDIRDFTSLSESMTPQENFNFLNSFLSQMEPVISLHRGVIDKYIGDAIMALFPDTPDDAVLGALAMLERLEAYNHGRNRAGYIPMRIGVGINTGFVMMGTVGGSGRMDGTVISDAVNVSARLEELTKTYGVPLLISEHTLHSLDDPQRYQIRFIDRLRLKGKHEPQSVYEIYDADPPPLRQAKARTQTQFEEALAYYHLRDIQQARSRLLACTADAPGDIPARIYLDRCDEYLRSGRYEGASESSLDPGWSDEFNTGSSDMDAPHRTLLGQLGSLATAIRDGRDGQIDSLFDHIRAFSLEHFEAEEGEMQDCGYAFLPEHVQQHRRFVINLDRLRERLQARSDDPLYLAFQIKLQLSDWLINHSLKFDRHLAQYMRQREQTPAS